VGSVVIIMQQKMFLIKKSNGIIYNFYFSKTGGICYKLYSLHNNQKVDPFEISVIEEKILEFYVNIDEEDTIHILCLTESGELKYFVNKENMWNSKVFSRFDLRSNIVKSLFIHVTNKKIYIIYAASNLMNVNLWTIYFKSWDGSKWNNINIGMTICDKEFPPYCLALDTQNNIHVVYKNSSNRGTQIFYRKFHMQFSLWSTPEKTINSPEAVGFYYIFCDTRNNLHLVWSTSTSTNFKMLYKKLNTKVLNNKHYDRIISVHMSNHPYLQPVIFEIEQKIWVMWRNQGEFSGCEIDSSGLSCSSVSSIQHAGSSSPILVEFINNYEMEKQSFSGRLLYGVVDDFIDLILPKSYSCDFYENIPTEASELDPEEFLANEYSPQNLVQELVTVNEKEKQVAAIQTLNEQLPSKVSEKFDEIKLDNQKIVKILKEVKEQLDNQDVIKILEEIKTQNVLLTELIAKTLEKNAITESVETSKNDGMLKKVFNFFK
jgi:hypothetical protein